MADVSSNTNGQDVNLKDETTGIGQVVELDQLGKGAARVINSADKQSASAIPFNIGVSMGLYPTLKNRAAFGINTSVGSGFETIWPGSNMYPFPSTGGTLVFSSSNANDTLLGTGARVLLVEGLETTTYNSISEFINMNGVANVTTVNSYIRLNSVSVVSVGSSGANIGTINALRAAVNIGIILPGASVTQQAVFSVPTGKTAYVSKGIFSYDKTKAAAIRLHMRVSGVKVTLLDLRNISGQLIYDSTYPLAVPEKSDIWLDGAVGTGGPEMSGGFELLLADN